jgi:hypothetical protein
MDLHGKIKKKITEDNRVVNTGILILDIAKKGRILHSETYPKSGDNA